MAQLTERDWTAAYDRARSLRVAGEAAAAVLELLPSVRPPSPFHGHYRELFLNYRGWNRRDLAAGLHEAVLERVAWMILLDDELVAAMEQSWREGWGEPAAPGQFDTYRKLLVGDARAMLRAAEAIGHAEGRHLALDALRRFPING